jgi:hypothetical protein
VKRGTANGTREWWAERRSARQSLWRRLGLVTGFGRAPAGPAPYRHLAGVYRRFPNLPYRRFPHRQAVQKSDAPGKRTVGGLGNPRYGRLGSLRYKKAAPSLALHLKPIKACKMQLCPPPPPSARVSVSRFPPWSGVGWGWRRAAGEPPALRSAGTPAPHGQRSDGVGLGRTGPGPGGSGRLNWRRDAALTRRQGRPMPLGFQHAIFIEMVEFIEETSVFVPFGKGGIESLREEITPALSRSSQFHPLAPHPAFGHPLPCPRERETARPPACPAGRPRRGGIVGRRNALRGVQ